MGNNKETSGGFKVSRRTFLKGSAVVGATGAAYAGGIAAVKNSTVLKGLEEAGQPAEEAAEEQTFMNVCSPNCWMGCRIQSHVRDGHLVKTSMLPFPEARYNRICLRGLSHVQWVNNPDRLKYPMKRMGARGEGKWERITWDEALDTIAAKFSEIRDKYGSQAVAFFPGSGSYGAINGGFGYGFSVFANVFQATNIQLAVDQAWPLGASQVTGEGFSGGNEPLDISNADLLIAWGSNMTESQPHNWHFVADMKDRGGKLVVIDSNYSILASKADKWIPIRPGSDPALGMSLLNVLIEEKLYDKPFVLAHTVGPFLVRGDTGLFLRGADGQSYMVWDLAQGRAVPFAEAKDPALEDGFVVDGIAVKPAFQLLKERVSKWTPEEAQKSTDVPPQDVRWLAREYGGTRKSFFYMGFGVDRWENGHQNGRIMATMAALTGNIGESGAALGAMGGAAFMMLFMAGYQLFAPTGTFAMPLNGWLAYDAIDKGVVKMLPPLDPADPSKGVAREPVEAPWPIKALYFNCVNISNFQDTNRFIGLLKDESKLELVVAADTMPTDTVQYADIVLPVNHWLENDDVVGGLHPYLAINEKAVAPQFETRSDFQIFKALAQKLGFGQHFEGEEKDYIEKIVGGLAGLLGAGAAPVLETFRRDGAVRFTPGPYVGNADKKFLSPTGRMEFYSERVVVNYPPQSFIPTALGEDPLPNWEPPTEAWEGTPESKKYPLVYMQEHSRWRVHTTFFNQPWLREANPEPYVEVNPADASSRGIKNGDHAEVFNDRGQTVARVRITGKMRPGYVNIPKGWQRRQTKDGSGFSDPTRNYAHRLSANGSYFDVLVDIRKVEA